MDVYLYLPCATRLVRSRLSEPHRPQAATSGKLRRSYSATVSWKLLPSTVKWNCRRPMRLVVIICNIKKEVY